MSINDSEFIKKRIISSIGVKQDIVENAELIAKIETAADKLIQSFKKDAKVFFCGNGGSAADAQHISAELSGRFYADREPLYAEAFNVNTSFITAVANDYGYDQVYSRMAKACCREGDVLVGLSTSGNSLNIVNAIETAKAMGTYTIAMTGETGGALTHMADLVLNVPSTDTPRIQESHILIGHILCEMVEKIMFE